MSSILHQPLMCECECLQGGRSDHGEVPSIDLIARNKLEEALG